MTDRSNEPTKKGAEPRFPEVGYEEWLRKVGAQSGGARKWVEGIEIEPLCTSEHPPTSKASVSLRSGEDQERSWVVCQAFSDQSPGKLNQYLKSDLANGVAGVRLRIDQGTGLSTVADFRQAFDEVEDGWRMLMLDAGTRFLPASAVLLSWLREAGLDLTDRSFLLAADPLQVLAETGRLDASLSALAADGASLVRYSSAELPNSRAMAVSTVPYREAGADIDQELAVAMAVAVYYLRAMEQEGLQPEVVVPEIAFVTATGQQTFLEIAKIRALRLLWEGVQIACDVDPTSRAWIHSTVLQRSLVGKDPATDLLRLTTASMSGILGGADSVETPGQAVARLGDPAEGGRRLARNTQNILALEAHLGRVNDPSAGSYLLETLTSEIAARAWTLFRAIEGKGGVLETLTTGWVQEQIAERWQKRCRSIEDGQIQILGANAYTDQGGGSGVPERAWNDPGDDDTQRTTAGLTPSLEDVTKPDGDRWEWSLKCANEGETVQRMSRALYGSSDHYAVSPLLPHRDGEPCDSESERR